MELKKYIGSGEDAIVVNSDSVAVLPMDMEAPEQEQHEDEECLENIE